MRSSSDPLYALFEQHLFNALVEDESSDDFVARVVADYLARLGQTSTIPHHIRPAVEEDLRDEVLEMLRKKTYGHYSLSEFRKAVTAPKARKSGPARAAANSPASAGGEEGAAKPAASPTRSRRRRVS